MKKMKCLKWTVLVLVLGGMVPYATAHPASIYSGTYVDATTGNTVAVNGTTPWYTTDATDVLWRLIQAPYPGGYGTGGNSDTAFESNGDGIKNGNSPQLVTTVGSLQPGGVYEVYVIYYGRDSQPNWRILADVTPFSTWDWGSDGVFYDRNNGRKTGYSGWLFGNVTYELEGYLGAVKADTGGTIKAYVDDYLPTTAYLRRTIYDGIVYKQVFRSVNPEPADKAVNLTTSLASLSWETPEPNLITSTVYLGTDPNRLTMKKVTLAPGAKTVALTSANFPGLVPLANQTTYYWIVDCIDKGNVTPGDVWSFNINENTAPVVDAGADQAVWLGMNGVAGQETVNLGGIVTDDGLPSPPAITLLWTQMAGPVVAISPDNVADTSVLLTEVGTYQFKLTANDGDKEGADEVTVTMGTNACDASHRIPDGPAWSASDYNRDCLVDLADFAEFVARWLDCTDILTHCGNMPM